MTAKAKPKPKPRHRSERPVHPVIVPVLAEALLSLRQIGALLDTSRSKLFQMIARGDYPEHDVSLGPKQPRWSVALHNRWMQEQRKD